jgi:hypothetical protein
MTETSLIYKLTETNEFKKLQKIGLQIHDNQRQFDLLTVYKELIDEMAWSRLFAYLLDSTQNHGLGQSAFRKLLEIIPELKVFSKSLPADKDTETLCVTEWKTENSRRIDILIKLTDKKGTIKAVVGIENKVDSGEQNDQVRDYQKSLIKAFPRIPKVLIYLTPDGRITETADDDLSCPALSVSFDSISTVCEQIKTQTTTQGQIFLSVLKNHIDKLTNNQIMDKEALQLIKKLYQDPAHRQAIKLIGQYSPNTRSVFEDISNRLGKSKVLPFTIDEIVYYPETSSNPHEFKLYIRELSDIVQNKGFDPIYMLHCENKNPDIGDIFTLRIAMWYYGFKGKDAASRSSLREKVSSNFAFPNSLGTDRHWSQWICIWTGNSYKLSDLGEKDVEGLTALLTNGIKQTYDQYKLGLKKLAKTRL